MPTLLQQLSTQEQEVARTIMTNLRTSLPKAMECINVLEQYKQQLALSESFAVFHSIVRKAITHGREPFQVYLRATDGMNEAIFNAIEEHIKHDVELTKIKNALHFNSFLANDIIAAKERLSMQSLYSKVSDRGREIADAFIQSIKGLQTIKSELLSDGEDFKVRLEKITSSEELDSIETEIEQYNQRMLVAYDALVPFPQDEIVAGALIEFLEENPHIAEIMETFNFHESLMDDILAARAKTDHHSSTGPSW